MSGRTYRISELANAVGITARTIRHYEDQGLLRPERKGQVRIYAESDRRRLQAICKGVRVGFSLAAIRELLSLRELKGEDSAQHLHRALDLFASRMADLERQRADIDSMLDDLRQGRADIELALAKRGHRIAATGARPKLIGFGLRPAEE
jgi:DNA-binding transcriptional MerR regulator